ncbi:hypothetical protein D9M71_599110 [compost metagenome]
MAPLPVRALSIGGLVSSLVLATRVNCPEARLYSARWITTRSVSGRVRVVGVLLGIARWLSAVTCRFIGRAGLSTDWAYQAPVVLASVRVRLGVWLIRVALAGGGGACTKTSCWARRSPFSLWRE